MERLLLTYEGRRYASIHSGIRGRGKTRCLGDDGEKRGVQALKIRQIEKMWNSESVKVKLCEK